MYYANMRLPPASDPLRLLSPESDDRHVRKLVARVEERLAVMDRVGPENLSSKALREDLMWLAMQQQALKAIRARWLARLDCRELET